MYLYEKARIANGFSPGGSAMTENIAVGRSVSGDRVDGKGSVAAWSCMELQEFGLGCSGPEVVRCWSQCCRWG